MDRTKVKYALWTNDVEDHSIWFNALRYQTGELVVKEGMPVLLDIYKRFGIKSTFYFTGYMAEHFPEVVRMIVADGHEVASHGYSMRWIRHDVCPMLCKWSI
jgi:peptidoglycan/xylan/chitin deacetylase (PgdA/CDA1 family)